MRVVARGRERLVRKWSFESGGESVWESKSWGFIVDNEDKEKKKCINSPALEWECMYGCGGGAIRVSDSTKCSKQVCYFQFLLPASYQLLIRYLLGLGG